jgi:hypothetical protein
MRSQLIRDIQGGIPWCMLFVDGVVLVDESRTGVDQKLKLSIWTLEVEYFSLSRYKTKYMKCVFNARSKTEYKKYVFSATHRRMGILDSMDMWYQRKTYFST